jgi:oligoribonuclease
MASDKKAEKKVNKLLWIDLEMTGLEVEKEVIIECAAIVTDFDFKTLETYEAVVRQEQKYLDGMDSWNKEHHGKSGLTAKVPHGRDSLLVENELIQLIERHFITEEERRPILCGNSISQDRLFIAKYWQNLDKRLHYRMLDVSSWKIVMNNKYSVKFEKQDKHRALDDIQESIQELKFYMGQVQPVKSR